MYRILRRIDCGDRGVLEQGTLSRLEWMKEHHLAKLMEVEAISEISPPPLKVLPGMSRKAKQYAREGIESASDLLEADTDELAERTKLDVKADKGVVESYLKPTLRKES